MIKRIITCSSLISILSLNGCNSEKNILSTRESLELGEFIELFMTPNEGSPNWSMGANELTPMISWFTDWISSEDCGIHVSCRRGEARISLMGKEMNHLRYRLEPVKWSFILYSDSPPKFGPTNLTVYPNCVTVECYFELKESIDTNKYEVIEICNAGPGGFKQTAYLIEAKGKNIYIIENQHSGSGGSSTSLDFLLYKPDSINDLCKLAKDME